MKIRATALGFAAVATLATAAYAAVTFDPDTGTGFVGKGDVQLALGYNNKQLQDNAGSLSFAVSSVTETTWLCRHNTNPMAADQERETTITTEGVLSSIARERNQITGFNLIGYSGTPTIETDGLAVGTCTGMRHLVEDSIEEGEASGFTVYVNGVALN